MAVVVATAGFNPTFPLTPARIGELAEHAGDTPAEQIVKVADALTLEMPLIHHPLIPTDAVRAEALRLLTAAT
ncbi:hypothetical protein HII36_21795 [Nonomuraea sp. NN258]|uniref:hypothetical protein n=1 Tax=Nonomuraea antri TaxID=2730852 RepID=UPI001C2BECFD|nr:hypothetical protein [Nonomuraea antri]NRQ34467.1 hypothetical protein [Nonomuraea antri]